MWCYEVSIKEKSTLNLLSFYVRIKLILKPPKAQWQGVKYVTFVIIFSDTRDYSLKFNE